MSKLPVLSGYEVIKALRMAGLMEYFHSINI